MLPAIRIRLRLLGMLRHAGVWPVAGVSVIALLTSLLPAATAVSLAWLIGSLEGALRSDRGVLDALVLPLGALAGVMLLGYALDSVRDAVHYLAQTKVDGAFRAEVSRLAATSSTIAALEKPEVQRLIQLAKADPTNWTERTPGAGAIACLVIAARTITLASSAAVLAAFAWWLIPLLIIPAIAVQRLARREGVGWFTIWREQSGEGLRRRVWSDANFDAGQAKELRIFGLGEYAVQRQLQHMRAMFLPVWRHVAGMMTRYWRQFLLTVVPMTVAFILVARSAVAGEASVAVATAALTAGAAVYRVLGGDPRDVVGALATLQAFEDLRAHLQSQTVRTAQPASRPQPAQPVDDVIRFEDVTFVYPGTTRKVGNGLTLEIRPRELLAIVGLNGAGKSTLIKLLAGLYEPTSGRITYGGIDIRDLGIEQWRRHLSIVFQDFVRYHLSVADNVALGNATVAADSKAIEAAGRDAGLDVVLNRLPQGWHTPLARTRSDGVDLSGGQWQQVVLARALYALRTGAHVLVLDEPTAHLDVRTEFAVFERLAAHKGEASVVLISHRLSTVRQADRIVLLDGGKVTESGTHDELMALGGKYAELFTIQAERFNRGYDDRIEEGDLW